jgi:hypothetical protein
MESVVDTMLHELAHNVHGPHDGKFHALWDQLRDEYQGLVVKGYSGEGFLSEGRRLGGRNMPNHEVRRVAREAAEKRRAGPLGTGSGQRLGGAAPRPGQDIRKVIASAVERRNTTLKGCATDKLSDTEIRDIADTATRNGFRTQAEEDEANEAAIAQALWELVQEDEQAKYGRSYIPPTAANPTGNGGGAVLAADHGPSGSRSVPDRGPVANAALHNAEQSSRSRSDEKQQRQQDSTWACETCTLHNPSNFLCCDACGAEKPDRPPALPPQSSRPNLPTAAPTATIDLTQSDDRSSPARSKAGVAAGSSQRTTARTGKGTGASPQTQPPRTWHCNFCGTEMERKWWTCSTCGLMKDNSR